MKLSTTADCSVISWSYKIIFDHYILFNSQYMKSKSNPDKYTSMFPKSMEDRESMS